MATVKNAPRWAGLPTEADRDRFERADLPAFLKRQRWFAGKARTLDAVKVVDLVEPEGFPDATCLMLIEVRFADGEPDTYFLPVALADGPAADRLARDAPARIIARPGGDKGALLYDAMADPAACLAILDAIGASRSIPTNSGTIRAFPTSAYGPARGPEEGPLEVILGKAEQSNTTVLFGDRLILKLFRRIQPGINPDFEIGRFLTESTRFDRIPKTAGAIESHRGGSEPITLAILQELVVNQGTGWEHALHELKGYYEEANRRHALPDAEVAPVASFVELSAKDAPAAVHRLIGPYLKAAALLGRRTAEMHAALASHPDVPAFAPAPLTEADLRAIAAEVRGQVRRALDTLAARLDALPPAASATARLVLDGAPRLLERLDALRGIAADSTKIRVHGDYHLGQTLQSGDDFVILDFEGEPAKSVDERRLKMPAMKDVVGMLRSFDYAAYAALFDHTKGRPDDLDRLEPWARVWQTWTSAAFLRAYRAAAEGATFVPADPASFAALMAAFTLDKSLYELSYELNNRPDWVTIPLRGIASLIEQEAPGSAIEPTPPPPGPRLETVTGSRLTEFDLHLLGEGTHYRSFDKLGAHPAERNGTTGTDFAVWAPNARGVSVVGDFNGWDPAADPMRSRGSSGVWERFVPATGPASAYKYAVISAETGTRVDKLDPYGFAVEQGPRRASLVADLSAYEWGDADWMAARRRWKVAGSAMSIYEVHLGSWMRVAGEGDRFLTYREVAPKLAEYVKEMGYTHVEFLPLAEHPFYGSWGYQQVGYFAATGRYGGPDDLMFLVDTLHRAGIGVILDWVPAHFPRDDDGLALFDGTHLYEYSDPRKGLQRDWNTYVFDYGRPEVVNFLVSNALFWLDRYHIDGLRVDAVASMLYLDYSRKEGEWVPNVYGGRENLEAIAFLRRLNERVHAEFPDALMIAEESTSWPMVSRPTAVGGLGFDLKWDLGWMHDSLDYMAFDPVYRKHHHNLLTFRGIYAFNESFVLPLSHDEVVYGKGSLLTKMAGDRWQKFANLRALLGWMFGQPGKKLLFMGDDFAQEREWGHDRDLDWPLLDDPLHRGVHRWVRDLNTLYRGVPALHELDCHPDGFEWADVNNAEESVVAIFRKGKAPGEIVLIACNFTPVPRSNYRIGVPKGGFWEEILNGDAAIYGGSGQGNLGGVSTTPVAWHGHLHSINLLLPPLATLALRWRAGE